MERGAGSAISIRITALLVIEMAGGIRVDEDGITMAPAILLRA
jgi:hypothetical protein